MPCQIQRTIYNARKRSTTSGLWRGWAGAWSRAEAQSHFRIYLVGSFRKVRLDLFRTSDYVLYHLFLRFEPEYIASEDRHMQPLEHQFDSPFGLDQFFHTNQEPLR